MSFVATFRSPDQSEFRIYAGKNRQLQPDQRLCAAQASMIMATLPTYVTRTTLFFLSVKLMLRVCRVIVAALMVVLQVSR
jgi:hypothetical protein